MFPSRFGTRFLALLLLSHAAHFTGNAQAPNPGNQTGLPVFGSFNGSQFDAVSMQNGALHIDIPLIAVPGRKGDVHYDFIYNTPSWTATFSQVGGQANSGTVAPTFDPASGWHLNNHLSWSLIWTQGSAQCAPQYDQSGTFVGYATNHNYYHWFALVDPEGTKHPLGIHWEAGGAGGSCPNFGTLPTGYTLDGSGIFVDISGWDPNSPDVFTQTKVTLRDGTKVTLGSTRRDANGNLLSLFADSLGRLLLSVSNGPTATYTSPLGKTLPAPSFQLFSITDSGGTTRTFRLDSQLIDIQTDGCTSGLAGSAPCHEDVEAWLVPKKLTLPDGLAYTFTYNNAAYAELQRIDLPSGGSIGYTYVRGGCQQIVANPGSPGPSGGCSIQNGCGGGQGGQTTILSLNSIVASRTVTNTDGTSAAWTYGIAFGDGVGEVNSVIDPLGTKELHTFTILASGTGPSAISSSIPYETDVKTYDSGGNLLHSLHKDYGLEVASADSPVGSPQIINARVIRETNTLDNGLVTKKETDYEAIPNSGTNPTATFLNPTEVREYGYSNGAPGSLLRRTDYTYLHQANSTYLNLNILDRATSVIVYDGAGNLRAQTQYEYDNYTTGIQASSAVQHDSSFGTSYTTRGNITATKRWRNTDGAWLTTRNQYDDAGNVLQTTDPAGNTTRFDYTDSWGNAACAPNGQGRAYLTKTTNALSQTAQNSFNSCTGTLASTTDVNNLATTWTYDLMNRPVTVTYPGGAQTNNCYSDLGGTNCSQSAPPLQIFTSQAINSSLNKTTAAVYDGLGRISQTALTSDIAGSDSTVMTYDLLGRISRVYNPTRCSTPTTNCGESTWGFISNAYDALNRTIAVTKQDGSQLSTAYAGNSTTVTDETGKQRRSFSDALGRLIEVDEPGGAAASSSTGSATLSGSEQSIAGVTAASGTGSATISGAEKSIAGTSAASGAGSATVSGSEKSIPAIPATSGAGSVTISGSEQSFSQQQCVQYDFTSGCVQWETVVTSDVGTVTITVNGFSKSVGYGASSTSSSIASALASALNNGSGTPVHASASGSVVNITSLATGTASNYSFSSSSATNDSADFSAPSFFASPASGTLAGGKNAVPAVYDSGSTWVTINGTQYSANYDQNSTSSSLASALATAISAGSLANASASGSGITITAKTTGASTNYSLSSGSSTGQSGSFSSPSFSVSISGSTLTGGVTGTPTIYDSGPVSVTINGTQYSVSYGQGSTATTVASALASAISAGSLANASASGSGITITAKTTGGSTNYSLSSASSTSQSGSFSSPSFSISVSGSSLTGGVDGKAAIYDSGSVWVIVNGTQATVTYGQGDTAASVAQRLQSNMGSLPVSVSLSGSTLTLTANATGVATNYSLSAGSSTSQSGSFSSPSFSVSTSGSALTGGADAVFSLSTPAITLYTYDALDNLLSVTQNGSHQRTFTYNSLKQLLTSNNPETGTITYTYDNDGRVATKTDARGITITYGYDALGRETSRTYSNGDPTITTNYDEANCLGLAQCQNIGHRTSVTDAAGSEAWAFDIPDRVHRQQRTTSGVTKTTTYALDLAGNTTQLTYPTGRVVNFTFDSANRPSSVADASSGILYATGPQSPPSGCSSTAACYAPTGAISAFSTGQSSSFTGLHLSHSYNNRLQPLEFKASSSAGNAIDITFSFVDPATSKNAGHVYGITNNLDTTRSQGFTYDGLNRLTSAQTTSTFATSPAHCWSEVFSLDPWANLQSIAATTNSAYFGCSQESGFSRAADGNNHLSGFSYDLAGNTSSDGVNGYVWDAESQLKTAAGVTYLYDGDGRRVSKSNGKLYWYGSGSDILAESDASGTTQNEYIFFGGQRIAVLPSNGSPNYYVEDLLGTSRVITQSNGAVCYDADFYPFGGERSYVNSCPQNYKFEGKERDAETGNDDFGARYYSNRFGRWLSADWSSVPVPVPYANLTNPQTLNLYAMVSDDTESFADLDGHDPEAEPSENPETNNQSQSADHGPGQASGPQPQVGSQQGQQQAQGTNSASQFARDEVRGIGKGIYNALADLDNWFYSGVNAALGTNFHVDEAKPATPVEKAAMAGTGLALLLVPGGAEAKAPEAVKLGKALASEAQVAGAGEAIFGAGAKGGRALKQAQRLAAEYGGKPEEWSKMTSGAYKAADGSVISTHWYERVGSAIKYEVKSIIDHAPWSK